METVVGGDVAAGDVGELTRGQRDDSDADAQPQAKQIA